MGVSYLMEHAFAVEHHLVEQYLLKELSPDVCDEFEDHYFGCAECAANLHKTDEFLKAVRTELQRPQLISNSATIHEAEPAYKPHLAGSRWGWRPAFSIAALAACLILVLYQNAVTLPRL